VSHVSLFARAINEGDQLDLDDVSCHLQCSECEHSIISVVLMHMIIHKRPGGRETSSEVACTSSVSRRVICTCKFSTTIYITHAPCHTIFHEFTSDIYTQESESQSESAMSSRLSLEMESLHKLEEVDLCFNLLASITMTLKH
jgi:hypothetical protein